MKDKALKALKGMKDKAVEVTSDVLSAPARKWNESKGRGYDRKRRQIETLREMKDVPDQGNEASPFFRARIDAIHDTFDREERKRKGN